MKKHLILLGILITSTMSWEQQAVAAMQLPSQIVIGRHENSPALQPCFEVITKAYISLGIHLQIREFPGRRSLQVANQGKVDGELCRIAKVGDVFDNLIKVEPPLMTINFQAVFKRGTFKIDSLEDLKGLKLVSIRGMQAAEMVLSEYNVSYEMFSKNLARLLRDGYADVLILPEYDIDDLQDQGGLALSSLERKTLYSFDLYHYLHIKNKHLSPKLSQAIKSILK